MCQLLDSHTLASSPPEETHKWSTKDVYYREKHMLQTRDKNTLEIFGASKTTRITPNRCPQLQLKSGSLFCEIRNFLTLRLEGRANIFADGCQEQIAGHELVFSNQIIFCRGNSYRKSFGPELAGHWFSKETNWPRKQPVCFAPKYLDPCCLAHIQSPGTNARPRRPIAAWKIYSQWSTHVATWHVDWMHCNRVLQGSNLSPCPKSSNLVKCQAGFITHSSRYLYIMSTKRSVLYVFGERLHQP